jgi:hypothetical protein
MGNTASAGPQAESTAVLELTAAGDWTITVTVDDDPECDDPPGVCIETVRVCPVDGDTTCEIVSVEGPEGGVAGTYTVTASATDTSGDAISYTFTADNGVDDPLVAGPQAENSADFELGPGTWTINLTVDDDPDCGDPPGECTDTIEVLPPGGMQLPGDCNQDGALDISDVMCLLHFLFLGDPPVLPCGDGSDGDPANLALLDANGDNGGGTGTVDLSDAIYILVYEILGGPPHVLGEECIRIPDCPDVDPCPAPPPGR